jgi:hypothetical protein
LLVAGTTTSNRRTGQQRDRLQVLREVVGRLRKQRHVGGMRQVIASSV